MTTLSKQISEVGSQIAKCNQTARDLWFGRKKFSVKHEDKLRERLHSIDLIREGLYARMWELYAQADWEGLDELDSFKSFNGTKKVRRYVYCDGQNHFIVKANGKFCYGTECLC